MKLKRFADGEAVVVGWEELMHNANEATKDELGARRGPATRRTRSVAARSERCWSATS